MRTGYKAVRRVMVCRCKRCKTKLRTRWPDTWQTHGWRCWQKASGIVRLYCARCSAVLDKKGFWKRLEERALKKTKSVAKKATKKGNRK